MKFLCLVYCILENLIVLQKLRFKESTLQASTSIGILSYELQTANMLLFLQKYVYGREGQKAVWTYRLWFTINLNLFHCFMCLLVAKNQNRIWNVWGRYLSFIKFKWEKIYSEHRLILERSTLAKHMYEHWCPLKVFALVLFGKLQVTQKVCSLVGGTLALSTCLAMRESD